MKNTILILLLMSSCYACQTSTSPTDYLNLSNKLSGEWRAKAFDGALHEKWQLTTDGWMLQQGYYIEQEDTSYSAQTKIEQVGEDIILFSVIKGSAPKIFQAIKVSDEAIVFENKDYRNPFEVTYEFLSQDNYQRTIKGYEQDSLVTYVFEFSKVK